MNSTKHSNDQHKSAQQEGRWATEYSDERRAANRRSVIRTGLALLVGLVLLAIFGDMDVGGFISLALGGLAFVALLWWLFASAKATPVPDPGPEGRRAAWLGAAVGFFRSQ